LNILKSSIVFCISVQILFNACKQKPEPKVQVGDMFFQQIECGPLCDAINKVTDGLHGKDYNHCALVVPLAQDSLVVIEAIGSQVHYTSLDTFFARVGDTKDSLKNTLHMRLKAPYKPLIAAASANSKQYLGQPYDDIFLLNNNKMYCSEVIYEAFKSANKEQPLFDCQPMTYKDPETKEFFPPWVDYFKSYQAAIPEGELGINPGLISRSNKLEEVH
jgi:hypothetical protein